MLYRSRDKNILPEQINTAYPGVLKGDLIYNFIDSIVSGKKEEIIQEENECQRNFM